MIRKHPDVLALAILFLFLAISSQAPPPVFAAGWPGHSPGVRLLTFSPPGFCVSDLVRQLFVAR